MVTGSKKPEASAAKAKSVTSAPKATAKAKTVASGTAAAKSVTSKPKKTAAKTPAAKAPAVKAAAKPKPASKPKPAAKPKAAAAKSVTSTRKATGKAKTTGAIKALMPARKVGQMVYNDELLESMAEAILGSSTADLTPALPEIKKQLFDYDIYMVSFLSDGEIGEIGAQVAKVVRADANDLTARLLTIRESARAFVGIAGKFNSVRAYLDSVILADGKEAGISRIREAFLTGEYCIADVDSAACESFLTLF